MISSEVQRTLVKSPPELWAELSDPTALARHLGELGEIRITRTEPESTVEWAAENTTGTVSIKPSGWGTKVTLSVIRETAERACAGHGAQKPEPASDLATEAQAQAEIVAAPAADAEPQTASAPDIEAQPQSVALESAPEPEPEPEPELELEPEAVSTESEPAVAPELPPAPRRGLFARLFGRHPKPQPAIEAPVADTGDARPERDETLEQPLSPEPAPERADAFEAVREVLAPETFAAAHPFAALAEPTPDGAASAIERETAGDPIGDISAELMAAEEVSAEEVTAEVTAVLTAVLDRLGAAHHRPFSRS
jgi:hypothetical protein